MGRASPLVDRYLVPELAAGQAGNCGENEMGYLYLAVAIVAEVIATSTLKASAVLHQTFSDRGGSAGLRDGVLLPVAMPQGDERRGGLRHMVGPRHRAGN